MSIFVRVLDAPIKFDTEIKQPEPGEITDLKATLNIDNGDSDTELTPVPVREDTRPNHSMRLIKSGDVIRAWITENYDTDQRRITLTERAALQHFSNEQSGVNNLGLNEIINGLIDIQALIERLTVETLEKPAYKGKKLEDITGEERDNFEAELLEAYIGTTGRSIDEVIDDINAAGSGALPRAFTDLIKQNVVNIDALEHPLDKINSNIWRMFEESPNGQEQFLINTGNNEKQDTVNTLVAINFEDDTKLSKSLTPFDKRVFTAAASLYTAGNKVITDTLIYKNMGFTGKPSQNQIENIHNSITKLMRTQILIDNTEEAAKYKYDLIRYEGALLPIVRKTGIINGKPVSGAIFFNGVPMLMEYSRRRGQITTIPLIVYQSSEISKTADNLAIEDYLIERIAHIKSGRGNPRILYETLFEKANVKTKMQKQRAPEKIKKYLSHYKKTGFIDGYTADAKGVTIVFTDKKEPEKKGRK